MIKKTYLTLAIVLSFGFLLVSSPSVLAQTKTVDDSQIQKSLEEQGLDKAPEPIDIQPSTVQKIPMTSGYVDDNGKPLSIEEFNKLQEDQDKGLLEKPVFYVALVVVVLVAAGAVVYSKRKK